MSSFDMASEKSYHSAKGEPENQTLRKIKNFGFKSFELKEWNSQTEPWDIYEELFKIELRVNEITCDEKKRSLLISKIGPQPLSILSNYFSSDLINNQTFDKLFCVLRSYYGKHCDHCTLGNRITFSRRFRENDESIEEYIRNIKLLAINCGFGTTLEERIMDKIITGINCDLCQQKLLLLHSSVESKLNDIEDSAVRLEKNSSNKKTLIPGNILKKLLAEPVKSLNDSKLLLIKGKHCSKCGQNIHIDEPCPAKGNLCHFCHNLDHFSKVCFLKGTTVFYNGPHQKSTKSFNSNLKQSEVICSSPDSNQESSIDTSCKHGQVDVWSSWSD